MYNVHVSLPFQWIICLKSSVMTCTHIVVMDTPTVTIPGFRCIVPRDATFARVRNVFNWLYYVIDAINRIIHGCAEIWNLSLNVKLFKSISHEWAQEIFCLFYKTSTNNKVFDDFPKICDHFPKIFEDFPNVFRKLTNWVRRKFPRRRTEDVSTWCRKILAHSTMKHANSSANMTSSIYSDVKDIVSFTV